MNPEKYQEFQTLSAELQEIQKQLQNSDRQINELQQLAEAITDFSKIKPGTDSLSTLGNGIFAKTKIEDTKELVLTVGANVTVTKTVEEVKKTVDSQIVEIENIVLELEKALSERSAKLQRLQEELLPETTKKKKNHINHEKEH